MGLFCASIHFQTEDRHAVDRALAATVDDPEVLDANGGWVSAYAPVLLEQSDPGIERLAASVSERLGVRAVSFWVYDSDIARYWLHDSGHLVDSYNSWSGYFEDAPPQPSGGNPELLAGFCPEGTQPEQLRTTMEAERVFAEDLVGDIAGALGIPQDRALQDYHHLENPTDATAPNNTRFDLDERSLWGQLPAVETNESAAAMVRSAADGDVAKLSELVADGAPLEDLAPLPLPGSDALTGLGLSVPGRIPEIPMTPLLAAITYNQQTAAEALLDLGADPGLPHEMYGSPVHAAAGAGNREILMILLDRGADPATKNPQGQTALEVLELSRQQLTLLEQTKSLLASMGTTLPPQLEQLGAIDDLATGLEACAEVLRARIEGEAPQR